MWSFLAALFFIRQSSVNTGVDGWCPFCFPLIICFREKDLESTAKATTYQSFLLHPSSCKDMQIAFDHFMVCNRCYICGYYSFTSEKHFYLGKLRIISKSLHYYTAILYQTHFADLKHNISTAVDLAPLNLFPSFQILQVFKYLGI